MSEQAHSVGSLAETPTLSLLLWVMNHAFTGSLVLAHDDVKKTIFFEQGKPVGARSNILPESLGQMLVAEGRLTETQLAKSLQMIKGKEALHQGEAFVAMKLIDHALLNEMLRRQLLARIWEVFQWADGKYGL